MMKMAFGASIHAERSEGHPEHRNRDRNEGEVVPHRHRVVQRAILERHPDVAYTYTSATELRDDRVNASPESLGSPTGVYGPPDLCLGYLRDAYWNF
jgi:hypothetical protein